MNFWDKNKSIIGLIKLNDEWTININNDKQGDNIGIEKQF
jgi:hypothetical protein